MAVKKKHITLLENNVLKYNFNFNKNKINYIFYFTLTEPMKSNIFFFEFKKLL